MSEFLLVTPAKNEEDFLPKVIDSVCSSTVIPKLWVIVDDNSSDSTKNIVLTNKKNNKFIELLSLNEPHPRDLVFHYSYVCKLGFDYAIQFANEKNINWDYIVLLDADTVVDSNYFEGVMSEMNANQKIGISSGNVHILKKDEVMHIKVLGDIPSGTARVWNKKCFYETGGYMITQAPDSVSRVKAHLNGWSVVRFNKYSAYQLRETSSAEGIWKGFFIKGKSAYFLNENPMLVLLNVLNLLSTINIRGSCAYIWGYSISSFRNEPQISDNAVKEYYWKGRLNEIFSKGLLWKHIIYRLK